MCGITVNWSLLSIYFLSFSSFASLSVIAPFFPSEADNKGISTSLAGGVFSIFGFTLIVMNAITGRVLPVVGSKLALTIGIIVVGVSNITFGLLDDINNSQVFIVLCYIVRAIEAIGTALLNTTSYLIIIKKCGDNLSKAIAINEACICIGLAVGPPLGSLFYSIGGYKLPFLVVGITTLLNVPFSIYLLENYRDTSVSEGQECNEQRLSYLKLFSIPKVVVVCLAIFVVENNSGVMNSTLELYLKSYEIGPKSVGFMFMIIAGTYTVMSLIIGNLFDLSNGFRFMTFGLFLNAFAFSIIGPSPFFVLRGSLVITSFALFLNGVGNAFVLVPSMPTILQVTADIGYSTSVNNSSCVSGLWTMIYAIGHTIGPYFGSALFEYFDFEILLTVIVIINLLCFFVSLQPFLCYHTTEELRRDGYTDIDGQDH